MLQDIPLKAEVSQLLKLYKAFGSDIQTLYNYLLQAESPHEFAAGLIAIRIETGSFGDGASGWQRNAFTDKGLDLATRLYDGVVENLHRGFVKQKFCKTYNETPLVTNLDNILVLSDEARKQQREYREAHGSTYIGARMVQPKAKSVTGMYWGKLANQNQVNYAR